MTEYEEAREAIELELLFFQDAILTNLLHKSEELVNVKKVADQILKLPNIAVLSKDQSLPDDKTDGHMKDSHDVGYIVAQHDMLKANFKRVISHD